MTAERVRLPVWLRVFGFIAVTVSALAGAGVGGVLGFIDAMPPVEPLIGYSPDQSSAVLAGNGRERIGGFARERRQVADIEEIPLNLQRAFLAVEDVRFRSHFGVDFRAVARTLVANRRTGSRGQGASTITMQLPRNVIPEKIGREKAWERKIRETFLALKIERGFTKDQILAFYLNHIFMGMNSFGVRAAAGTYFDKDLSELTIAECATLAAIPKGPSIYNPIADPERARVRRNLVLEELMDAGWLDRRGFARARDSELAVRPGQRGGNAANSRYPYFVDALRRDLKGEYGFSDETLSGEGLVIRSTVDGGMQRIVEEELAVGLRRAEGMWHERLVDRVGRSEISSGPTLPSPGQVRLVRIETILEDSIEVDVDGYFGTLRFDGEPPFHDPEAILRPGNLILARVTEADLPARRVRLEAADRLPIQGSAVILDVGSGEVLALVGGADFGDRDARGQFNRAIMGGKPAGSTVKPFFYAVALDRGFGPEDIIIDEELILPGGTEPWIPQNYERRYFGPTTLIEGLEHSRNITTIRLFQRLGVRAALDRVCEFDYRGADGPWSGRFGEHLPVCLGTVDMNALEVAAGYLAFAAGGKIRKPVFFRSVRDPHGTLIRRPDDRERRVTDPVTAAQMTRMLRQVVLTGSGRAGVGERFPETLFPQIAGKTGTTDNNSDAWFVGYTPELVICVHVGFDNPRPMGERMTGGRVAAPIWAGIFRRVFNLRDDWKMTFDEPPGLVHAEICSLSGKTASGVCSQYGHRIYASVPYRPDALPTDLCDGRPREPIIVPIGRDHAEMSGRVAE